MLLYLTKFSYAPETWARLIGKPGNEGSKMRNRLKWIGITVGGIVGIIFAVSMVFMLIGRSRLHARHELPPTLPAEVITTASAEKGEVIAITRGCTDCHDTGMKGKVFRAVAN